MAYEKYETKLNLEWLISKTAFCTFVHQTIHSTLFSIETLWLWSL